MRNKLGLHYFLGGEEEALDICIDNSELRNNLMLWAAFQKKKIGNFYVA